MLWYYFTITYYNDSDPYTHGSSYSVAAASRVLAWKRAIEYATAVYGLGLCKVELHTVSTY